MSNRMHLLQAYRDGYRAGVGWRTGLPVRCPYWRPSRWMAWHCGFDRALYLDLNRPPGYRGSLCEPLPPQGIGPAD